MSETKQKKMKTLDYLRDDRLSKREKAVVLMGSKEASRVQPGLRAMRICRKMPGGKAVFTWGTGIVASAFFTPAGGLAVKVGAQAAWEVDERVQTKAQAIRERPDLATPAAVEAVPAADGRPPRPVLSDRNHASENSPYAPAIEQGRGQGHEREHDGI